MHFWKGAEKFGQGPPPPSFGKNPKEQLFFLRTTSLIMILLIDYLIFWRLESITSDFDVFLQSWKMKALSDVFDSWLFESLTFMVEAESAVCRVQNLVGTCFAFIRELFQSNIWPFNSTQQHSTRNGACSKTISTLFESFAMMIYSINNKVGPKQLNGWVSSALATLFDGTFFFF